MAGEVKPSRGRWGPASGGGSLPFLSQREASPRGGSHLCRGVECLPQGREAGAGLWKCGHELWGLGLCPPAVCTCAAHRMPDSPSGWPGHRAEPEPRVPFAWAFGKCAARSFFAHLCPVLCLSLFSVGLLWSLGLRVLLPDLWVSLSSACVWCHTLLSGVTHRSQVGQLLSVEPGVGCSG